MRSSLSLPSRRIAGLPAGVAPVTSCGLPLATTLFALVVWSAQDATVVPVERVTLRSDSRRSTKPLVTKALAPLPVTLTVMVALPDSSAESVAVAVMV